MVVTPEQAARTLVERAARRLAAVEARRVRLRAALPALSELLHRRCGASRVWLFGSLAWGGFHAASDVDVAVESVAPECADAAMVEASQLLSEPVELFRIESLPASFQQRIRAEGEELA